MSKTEYYGDGQWSAFPGPTGVSTKNVIKKTNKQTEKRKSECYKIGVNSYW